MHTHSVSLDAVGNTCDDVLSTLGNLKACNDLNQLAIKAGQEAANSDCEGARTIGRKYFNTMPPECCEPLRVMVEQVTGLLTLPAGPFC